MVQYVSSVRNMTMPMSETHPLQPFLPQDAQLLMLGSFPPPKNKWKMNFFYPNYQNDMWRIMGSIFYQDKDYFLDVEHKMFKLSLIKDFLITHHIAIYDVAAAVIRHQGNASDKHLEIVQPIDLKHMLELIPSCQTIMTTGDKATESLMTHFTASTMKPSILKSSQTIFHDRALKLYRLPSSSRAYPLALTEKVKAYQHFFQEIGML